MCHLLCIFAKYTSMPRQHANNAPSSVKFIIKIPQKALDVALYILSLTIEQRNELGFQAAEYARKHLEATVVYSNIVSVVHELLINTNISLIFESNQQWKIN
jgi:hypothetical protein